MSLHARLPDDLESWLEEEAQAEQRSKNAIMVTALEEYRQRRDLAHVLELGANASRRHRSVLDRLADA